MNVILKLKCCLHSSANGICYFLHNTSFKGAEFKPLIYSITVLQIVPKIGSFNHVILSVLHTLSWARFLSLARNKLRLCSANHRAAYFSNLACDWQSIVWPYPDDPANFPVLWQCYTEYFICYENIDTCNSLPSCHNLEDTSAFPSLHIPARKRRILCIILHGE